MSPPPARPFFGCQSAAVHRRDRVEGAAPRRGNVRLPTPLPGLRVQRGIRRSSRIHPRRRIANDRLEDARPHGAVLRETVRDGIEHERRLPPRHQRQHGLRPAGQEPAVKVGIRLVSRRGPEPSRHAPAGLPRTRHVRHRDAGVSSSQAGQAASSHESVWSSSNSASQGRSSSRSLTGSDFTCSAICSTRVVLKGILASWQHRGNSVLKADTRGVRRTAPDQWLATKRLPTPLGFIASPLHRLVRDALGFP